MPANIGKYKDYLDYLPEKEREAAQQAICANNKDDRMTMAIIRRTNRQKPVTANPKKGRRNLLKQS
jgi:hypothetical protein